MEGNYVIMGVLAPLFLFRRPLSGEERRSLRSSVALWVVGVAGCVAFVVVNRHQLKLPVVLFGDHLWLLWVGLGALLAAGLFLEGSERSRRREKEKGFRRERGGLPPLDGETTEESRPLSTEVDRLERGQK